MIIKNIRKIKSIPLVYNLDVADNHNYVANGALVHNCEESCLINYDVYRAMISRMLGDSPDSTMVEIGNPWHRDNQMWKHWTDPDCMQIHIGYKQGLAEGRTTESFIEQQRRDLLPVEFKILYDAEFPEESSDSLLKYAWVKSAIEQDFAEKPIKQKVMGVDVAEGGVDLTVASIANEHEGNIYSVIDIVHYHEADTDKTTGNLYELAVKHGVAKVTIDATGVGKGVADQLERLLSGKASVIQFKGGQSPTYSRDKIDFANRKAQQYWELRECFEQGRIKIPDLHILKNQLMQIKYELRNGKIVIEDGKKTGLKSPDFCFDGNTMITTIDGSKPIKDIVVGELVRTPFGYRKVTAKSDRIVNEIVRLKTTNGVELVTTAGHKFFNGKVFKHLCSYTYRDKFVNDNVLMGLKWKLKKLLHTKERNIGFRELIDTTTMTDTMEQEKRGGLRKLYTDRYGKTPTSRQYLKGLLSIIKTKIPLTINPVILSWLREVNTNLIMFLNGLKTQPIRKRIRNHLKKLKKKQRSGMVLNKGENGIINTISTHSPKLKNIITSVGYVVMDSSLHGLEALDSVLVNVGINTIGTSSVKYENKRSRVFNLTVETDGVYFANGLLVSNSDSLCYTVGGKSGMVFDFS